MSLTSQIAAALLLPALLLFIGAASAHDSEHPEMNQWLGTLHSGRGHCCSDHDATNLADPDWDSQGGHYRVRLNGEWIIVPDDAVITEPNKDGRARVWPYQGPNGTAIRCFLPGAGA